MTREEKAKQFFEDLISETNRVLADRPDKLHEVKCVITYYEAAIEALQERPKGRWIELPCEIGDTVWFIRPLSKEEITETTVEKIVVKGKGLYMKLACNAMYETSCNSIGKTVFFTQEEAEKALADMRESE